MNRFFLYLFNSIRTALIWTLLLAATSAQGQPLISRIKDVATLDGIQDNPLIGYGLVGGLDGTGDGRRGFTAQTLNNLLAGMGINYSAECPHH